MALAALYPTFIWSGQTNRSDRQKWLERLVLHLQILAVDACKEPGASKEAFSNFMRAEILPTFGRATRSLTLLKVWL